MSDKLFIDIVTVLIILLINLLAFE